VASSVKPPHSAATPRRAARAGAQEAQEAESVADEAEPEEEDMDALLAGLPHAADSL